MKKRQTLTIVIIVTLIIITGLLGNYYKNRPKLIALTFDDGPSPYTKELLDGLEARNVVVTFFMNGENGTEGTCGINNGHEALLTQMWENGHQLANHTYNHIQLDELSAEQITSEVSEVEKLIFDAAGGSYKCLVRTPGGHINENISLSVGAPIIRWSIDTEDWKYRNADYVYNTILSSAEDGSIILMHDIYETSINGALRAIDALKKQGYEFVTVSELMRRTGVKMIDGEAYSNAKKSIIYLPAYNAPKITVSENDNSTEIWITCSAASQLSIYYTTDGSYPKLSSYKYSRPIAVEPGMVFTAIGIDKWGTRTPPVSVQICASDK